MKRQLFLLVAIIMLVCTATGSAQPPAGGAALTAGTGELLEESEQYIESAYDPDAELAANAASLSELRTEPEQDLTEPSAVSLSETPDDSWYDENQGEYTISSEAQLVSLANLVNGGNSFENKVIKLSQNIFLTEKFSGIGSKINNKPFSGTFNGCGFEIQNLIMTGSATNEDGPALFGYTTSSAVIKGLKVSGSVQAPYSATVVFHNEGTIEEVLNRASVTATTRNGGICYTNDGTIRNSVNVGPLINMDGATTTTAGGISAINNGKIENCENRGSIGSPASNSCFAAGGIAGTNTGTVENSRNLAPVYGSGTPRGDFSGGVGGIAGRSTKVGSGNGQITGCVNTGRVYGYGQYLGGIAGRSEHSISNCKNIGGVVNEKNTVGGIVGSTSASISDCANGGAVESRGSVSSTNNAGGIAGWTTSSVERCVNTGAVSASMNNAGGIVGNLNSGSVTDCYSIADATAPENAGGLVGLNSGSLSYSYSIGTNKNVTGNGGQITACSQYADLTVGALTNDEALDVLNHGEENWVQGTGFPLLQSQAGAADAAAVTNEEQLKTALRENSGKILLAADITLTENLTVSGPVRLNGGLHTIRCGAFQFTVQGGTVEDVAVSTGGEYAVQAGGGLTLAGAVSLCGYTKSGIFLKDGALSGSGFSLGYEDAALPSVIVQKGGTAAGLSDYFTSETETRLAYSPVYTAVRKSSIVVPKGDETQNPGIAYDIQAFYSGKTCYLYLPSKADLTQVTYRLHDGETGEDTLETVDLSGGKTGTVQVDGISYTLQAMQSELPSMYLQVNDEPDLKAMNESFDHSIRAYGAMRLDVPQKLVKEKGWAESYQRTGSKDVEVKGRGNSSWLGAIQNNSQRPYQIKFSTKIDLLNMGNAKTWTLLRPASGSFHVANKAALDLAQEMGMPYSSKAELVEVWMNGEYVGLYTLAEKVQIGTNRIEITDLEDVVDKEPDGSLDQIDKTGGYLVEIDNTVDTLQFQTNGNTLTIKSPENLDDTVNDTTSRYSYIVTLMSDVFDAVYGNGYLTKGENAGKHFTEVLDMDSVAKYFWHQELTSNLDSCLGSTFFYKDKDSVDPRVHMDIVWDNDRAYTKGAAEKWVLMNTVNTNNPDVELFLSALLKHKEAVSYIETYYKNTAYSDIAKIFRESAEKAYQTATDVEAAANHSNRRWGISYNFNPSEIRTFIDTKSSWVDEHIDELRANAAKGEFLPFVMNTEYENNNLTYQIVNNTETTIPEAQVLIGTYQDDFLTGSKVDPVADWAPDAVIRGTMPSSAAESTKLYLWDDQNRPLLKTPYRIYP